MREKKPYVILTFAATTAAMAMEKRCQEQGLPGRMIPVPREITAGCGLAWRIPAGEYEATRERIEALKIPVESVVPLMM